MALAAAWLTPTPARAIACTATGRCAGGAPCVLPADGSTGTCLPVDCLDIDPAVLRERCFTSVGGMPSFDAGDCDGDLVPNDVDTVLCDGAAVISLSAGTVTWHASTRLDEGATPIAPTDATTDIPDAIGIGCQPSRPCPALRGSPELVSRCVYLSSDALGPIGVCTYFNDPRDDASCLGTTLPDTCVRTGEPGSWGWEHGDCDLDGLINKLDPHVCRSLEVIGQVSAGTAVCLVGTVDDAGCPGDVAQVGLDSFGCASDPRMPPAFTPFAFCCRENSDCPIEDLRHPIASFPRCVLLGTDAGGDSIGACTYDEVARDRDVSCVATGGFGEACFLDGLDYAAWASGDCDHSCDPTPNASDDAVCICAGADAGLSMLDAAAPLDGGTAPTDGGARPMDASAMDDASTSDDAGSTDDAGSADDVGAGRDDAAALPPASFTGSGCRCSVPVRSAAPSHVALVALAGLLALALGARARRRAG